MIYVDHARIPFMNMLMSHLIADTPDELRQAATHLGLSNHIQYAGTPKEHLDVSETTRTKAIQLGAVPVTSKHIVRIIRTRTKPPTPPEETPPCPPGP